MGTLRRFFSYGLSGAIVGAVVATFALAGYLPWYNTPGGSAQSMCSCSETVHNTISQMVRGQVIGAIVGAVVFLIIGIVLSRPRKHPMIGQHAGVPPHPPVPPSP